MKRPTIIVLMLAFLLLTTSVLHPLDIRASLPKLETIRVLLFGEIGKFKTSAAAVTLSSNSGLDVGFKLESGIVLNVVSTSAPTTRIRLDTFSGSYGNAGSYPTEAETRQRMIALREQGITAELSVQPADQGGTIQYSVWIPLPSVNVNETNNYPMADSGKPYIIVREELTANGNVLDISTNSGTASSGHKLWVTPQNSAQDNANSSIKIKEKNDRSYAGSLEISKYNGAFTVVNEVNFERYVYSVVGAEMGNSWPPEALKAQAVAARTFALNQGLKYQIAHISDSVIDQAYYGVAYELPEAAEAVRQTTGIVIVDGEGLITPFYSANTGGMTADPLEVFGSKIPYLRSVPSPDENMIRNKTEWHRVMLSNGTIGYITAEFVRDTGERNEQGLPYYESTGSNVNIRPLPKVDNTLSPPITKVQIGDRMLSLESVAEVSSVAWTRGPYTPSELLSMINKTLAKPITGSLQSLEISKRGPSGRAIEIKANGQVLDVPYPDALRNLFGGLPSTRFEIEGTGGYTILAADSVTIDFPANGTRVYAQSDQSSQILNSSSLYVIGQDLDVRPISSTTGFLFRGQGNGHGLGLSQWGARGLADLGYSYVKILEYYYTGVSVVKVE